MRRAYADGRRVARKIDRRAVVASCPGGRPTKPLGQARAAYDVQSWTQALESYRVAESRGAELDPEDLERMAASAWLTYGIHVLGGPLFDDGISRLYVFDLDAQLFEADPDTLMLSGVLVTGPALPGGFPGLCGMAGPLTDCVSGFPQG